ncbi:MAG: choice-of-anchor D domain-containing protein, partial [Bacteroidia bacterium]|nr:choice-of-anchor D domain-containing protein [Bacteroidia bacterium]
LGRCSFENNVASPFPQDKTIVVGLDDSTPGQVYVYVGNKSTSGNTIEKAGLFGGRLYGISVLGLYNEVSSSIPAAGTTFTLVDLGLVHNTTGATLQTNSANYGVTNFLRPEDGAWDPNNPRDFYFVTTNSFTSPSRMWRLRFTDITNPELGGTITAVLDGTEGPKMMDNLTVDNNGHILIQEDPGGNNHRAKVWQYKISTDAISLVMDHDSTRFQTGGANYITIDEEASGIIDMQGVLGAGWFLQYDQIHSSVAGPVVEMGQLQAYFNPATAAANPEINVQGNAISIVDGATTTNAGNGTLFGLSNVGTAITRTFNIQNTNSGTLIVSSLKMTGANAGDFFISGPSTPFVINGNASQSITVIFTPPMAGTRNAILNVTSSDWDENIYDFAVQGTGALAEIDMQGNSISIIDGNSTISTGDNTDFGTVIYNTPVVQEFKIQNTGNGTLTVSGITISGANASDFTLLGLPSFPLALSGNAAQTFSVQYLSSVPNSTSNAIINVISNDADEANYDFAISGRSTLDVGIKQNTNDESFVKIFPNPAKDEVSLNMNLKSNGSVVVSVYDLQGKKVMTTTEKELSRGEIIITLNTTALQSGEYFVEINANGKTNRQKLVVIH